MMTGMDLGLTGRRCLVTGASRGIGRATALALHAEGAHVLMVAREEAGLIAVAEEGEAARSERHGSLDYLALDLVEPDAAQRAVSCCVEQLGGIDVLVNNAGTSFARPLAELTDSDWQGQWDLHVMAPMRLMRAAHGTGGVGTDGQRVLLLGQAALAAKRCLLGDQVCPAGSVAGLR